MIALPVAASAVTLPPVPAVPPVRFVVHSYAARSRRRQARASWWMLAAVAVANVAIGLAVAHAL